MNALEKLIYPISREHFFREIFEKQPARFVGGEFSRLISVKDLSFLVKAASEVCPNRLRINVGGRALVPPRGANAEQLQNWALTSYADGATIIINYIEALDLTCAKFACRLGDSLGARVSLTLFATPEGSQGFVPHFDTLDVFVLQQSGSKNWCLGEAAVELPTLRQGELVDSQGEQRLRATDFVLEEGEVLYIPRGFVHWARTSTNASLHVTADLGTACAGEVLSEAVRQLDPNDPSVWVREGEGRLVHLRASGVDLRALASRLLDSDAIDSFRAHAIVRKWAKKVA